MPNVFLQDDAEAGGTMPDHDGDNTGIGYEDPPQWGEHMDDSIAKSANQNHESADVPAYDDEEADDFAGPGTVFVPARTEQGKKTASNLRWMRCNYYKRTRRALIEKSQDPNDNLTLNRAVLLYEQLMCLKAEKIQATTMFNKQNGLGPDRSIGIMIGLLKTLTSDSRSIFIRMLGTAPVVASVYGYF